jgi:hypothetical protein
MNKKSKAIGKQQKMGCIKYKQFWIYSKEQVHLQNKETQM